ncbi:TetR family transcriptional regulator [Nocardia flavorosea]|uniref:TetR family transcriptional regulator n=1 Tax=Nocardia flavorosea TaxID=53429 RepID=UPI001892E90B|nr:TetR family transcriptional regulator [Nocardia flavorosea]MBF6347406.1 TetR family transcriptional regulator [Nocardia flavorosea]
MSPAPKAAPTDQIVDVVLHLLETEGHEAVQLREVARRAHVSLATVYKHFADRDELIVTAVEHWMATHSFAAMQPPRCGETLHEVLMRVLGYVFQPWERHPRMLEAYHRARTGPSGHRLDTQGIEAMQPILATLFERADPTYIEDIALVLANLTYALIGRFADHNLEITEILPILDRAVYRLTHDNADDAATAVAGAPNGHSAADATVIASLATPFRGTTPTQN